LHPTKPACEPQSAAPGPEQVIDLERGRLIARPGPDLYLYRFQNPGGPLPEIGRRGHFILGGHSFPAHLADRRGPELSIGLTADKPLGPSLSGQFKPGPVPQPLVLEADPEMIGGPAGADLFLDAGEGWALSAAEAAGAGAACFEPGQWPAVPWAELPGQLSPAGITFIWRQNPDQDSTAARTLVEHFQGRGERVLVLGDAPADLEPLAGLPGAVHPGPAQPGTPLHPISVYTKAAEATEARETEIAVLRRSLADINRQEAGLKAKLSRWDDLDQLEGQFERLAREAAHHREGWDEARKELQEARSDWEEANQELEGKSGGGLLGWLRPGGRSREAAAKEESGRRRTLEEAEKIMAAARREEDGLLAEARRLEGQLAELRRQSESWTSRSELALDLGQARENTSLVANLIAAAQSRPQLRPDDFLSPKRGRTPLKSGLAAAGRPGASLAAPMPEAEAVLALMADWSRPEGGPRQWGRFGAVLVLASQPRDHAGRLALAALARLPEKHLVIVGDFTFWPVWNGRPPRLRPAGSPETDSSPAPPAWCGLMAAEEQDEFKTFLAAGGLFQPDGDLRAGGPALARLELGRWVAESRPTASLKNDEDESSRPYPPPRRNGSSGRSRSGGDENPAACGLGLRALGEMGPANPASALMIARSALNFAQQLQEPGPALIILTASPAHSRLINLMLADLEAPAGRIFCGEPQSFLHWPRVPLVILEPAFEAPHLSHPWAWPSFGRQRLMWAWQLARDQIWLAGRDSWLSRLPEASPLAALWRLAEPRAAAEFSLPVKQKVPSFWEALDKAKSEVWAIVPTFEAFWWRSLEEHFLAAARRRVQVTLLSAPPGDGCDREYAATAIRTLSAYGCSVHLATGLPGFLAAVDGRHLSWGHFLEGRQGSSASQVWGGLKSALLPRAVPAIGDILQIGLIKERMGRRGGGLKNCRHCGWPLVLINQEQARGFSDEQPLKIGCLNNCQGPKNNRRLDDREPFTAPPKCGQDRRSPYQRVWRGRQEVWVCPQHPDGRDCPSYRVLPGDVA